jgi:hypothetical protein
VEILQYNEVTTLTGLEQFLFALPGGDPANTINANNLATYILGLNAYVTNGVNIGNEGVGVFSSAAGGYLRFNNIAPASNRITATLDGNHNILIDVDVGNLLLSALGGDINLTSQVSGYLPVANGGTGAGDATSARANLGAASAGANTDITSILLSQFGFASNSAGAGNLLIGTSDTLTADRMFDIVLGDASRTLTMAGDATISGVNSGDQTTTLTGDVTGSGVSTVATAISLNAVTLGQMAQMSSQEFIGRNSAGTGDPEYIDQPTAKSMLGLNINTSRSYSSQTLAFSTPRTPNATQDTFVIITVNSVLAPTNTAEFDIQVAGVTVATVLFDNEGALSATESTPVSIFVPANSAYQINESGTATNSITSIYELTF